MFTGPDKAEFHRLPNADGFGAPKFSRVPPSEWLLASFQQFRVTVGCATNNPGFSFPVTLSMKLLLGPTIWLLFPKFLYLRLHLPASSEP